MTFRRILLSFGALLSFSAAVLPAPARAQQAQVQIQPPIKKQLFQSDLKKEKNRKKKALTQAAKSDRAPSNELDIKAPSVTFEKDQKVAHAQGGIIVSSGGNRIEADQGKVNLETKDTDVQGRVVITGAGAQVIAEQGKFNLDSETGTFNCGDVSIDDGNYRAHGEEVAKLSEDRFNLKNARMTTCNCLDEKGGSAKGGSCGEGDSQPWTVHSDTVHITRDGYAHTYGSWVDFQGVPLFYTPYLGFPVKEERQSGLLVPSLGYSSKDGFKARIPLYLVVDDSSDVLMAPFTETQTRTGVGLEYRKNFSRYNQLQSRLLFSDESARDGDLRGTNVDGIFAPSPDYQYYDDNRVAGTYKHVWRSSPESGLPLSFIADGRYVSDRLVLREIETEDLGERTERDVISTAVLRSGLGEYGEAELLGEYGQALDDRDQQYIVQRLPEARLTLSKSLRPFGYNPYGVKVVTQLQYLGDEFSRDSGYDGFRSHYAPSVGVPFHIENFLQGTVSYSYLHTDYYLDDTSVPNIATEQSQLSGIDNLDDSSSRNIGVFQAQLGTDVERVYALDDDSWLRTLTALGSQNQANRLVRLKHTITPSIKFLNIPDVDQSDLPVFDSLGRISEKRVVSYGFSTSLYGRFLPLNRSQEPIPELVPEISDLPTVAGDTTPLSEDELFDNFNIGGNVSIRNGEVRELARLVVRQAYDYIEAQKDKNPNRNAFSDISTDLYLMPTGSFAFGAETNYNQEYGRVDSVSLPLHFFDDRRDALRGRWNFVRNSDSGERTLSQFEASIEVKVNEPLRLGWYSRFDELHGTALENHAVIRLISSCNCWHLDLDYGQTENPQREEVLLRFTFSGLGDISSGTRVGNRTN